MYKGSDIIGKPIISFDSGKIIERIKDVLFDAPARKILGLLVEEGGLLSKARILPFSKIKSIGQDAVTVDSGNVIVDSEADTRLGEVSKSKNVARGTKVLTEDGKNLGVINDVYFDEGTGQIEGYEVSGGVFSDAYTGRSFLPAPEALKIGEDVAFVPVQIAQMMEEQVGGVKGVAGRAAGAMSDVKEQAAAAMGSSLESAKNILSEQAANAKRQIGEATSQAMPASPLGRRVRRTVRGANGTIVAAVGQVVTPAVESLAVQYGKAKELAEATIGAGESDIRHGVKAAGEAVSSGTTQAKEAAGKVWDNIKEKTKELTQKAADKNEEQRIQAVLGRPVERVVLAPDDSVILNIGDLVSNEAVEKAKSHGVLNMLLNSVSPDRPSFSSDELKSKKMEGNADN